MSKKSDWLKAYAEYMQQHIIGGFAYQYCYDCALNTFGELEWMNETVDTYPGEDAAHDEMECWDD